MFNTLTETTSERNIWCLVQFISQKCHSKLTLISAEASVADHFLQNTAFSTRYYIITTVLIYSSIRQVGQRFWRYSADRRLDWTVYKENGTKNKLCMCCELRFASKHK